MRYHKLRKHKKSKKTEGSTDPEDGDDEEKETSETSEEVSDGEPEVQEEPMVGTEEEVLKVLQILKQEPTEWKPCPEGEWEVEHFENIPVFFKANWKAKNNNSLFQD